MNYDILQHSGNICTSTPDDKRPMLISAEQFVWLDNASDTLDVNENINELLVQYKGTSEDQQDAKRDW